MEIIKGEFAEAYVYTDDIEEYASAQIKMILDNDVSKGSKVRVMPDVHPGKVGPIGLTMTIGDKILPSLLGIDIGCGMLLCRLRTKGMEFSKLDKVIMENIPSGYDIRKKHLHDADNGLLDELYCKDHIDAGKALRSLGTLGGGNHFIEVDTSDGDKYLMIHSGSRHLGKEVSEYYLNKGRQEGVPYEMTYLTGALMDNYIHDVEVLCEFASYNRRLILNEILKGMKWKEEECIESVHNYLGRLPDGKLILRKGSISALEGQDTVIPINMRDGVILGKGKGNPDWNYSAPHGSGRKIRRDEVKNSYTLSSFKADMKGIYSPSVSKDTLDEAPVAYRNMEDILSKIEKTVEVSRILRPIYNFKAGNRR